MQNKVRELREELGVARIIPMSVLGKLAARISYKT